VKNAARIVHREALPQQGSEYVFHGDGVEHAIVHVESPGSVVLLDKQHWR
jgi:hypothetical protein